MTTPLGSNHKWHLRCLLLRATHPWNWKAGKLRSMEEIQVPKVRHNLLYTTPINSVRNTQAFKLQYGARASGHHYLHKNSEASSKHTKLHTAATSLFSREKRDQNLLKTINWAESLCPFLPCILPSPTCAPPRSVLLFLLHAWSLGKACYNPCFPWTSEQRQHLITYKAQNILGVWSQPHLLPSLSNAPAIKGSYKQLWMQLDIWNQLPWATTRQVPVHKCQRQSEI